MLALALPPFFVSVEERGNEGEGGEIKIWLSVSWCGVPKSLLVRPCLFHKAERGKEG